MKHEKLAKLAAYALRHKPDAVYSEVDAEGWMPVTAFVPTICSLTELHEMVEEDTKTRYSIKETPQGDMIRCNYGHSIPHVKIPAEVHLEAFPDLWHATTEAAYEKIKTTGILSMSRNSVHLSSNRQLAVNVAMRYAKVKEKVVVLKIVNPETIEGLKLAADEVWVCPHVPVKNFVKESL